MLDENIKKFKILLISLVVPIAIYFIITIIVGLFFLTLNDFENGIIHTGIAGFFTLIILIPLYIKFSKLRNDEIKKVDFNLIKYFIILSIALCLFENFFISFLNLETNDVSNNIFSLNIFLGILISCVITPLVEEVIFRGFIYKTLEFTLNIPFAIIISSLFFAIFHFDLSQGIYAFFTGLILSLFYYKYKNILYPIMIHSFMNLTTYLIFKDISLEYMEFKSKIFILIVSFIVIILIFYRLYKLDKE